LRGFNGLSLKSNGLFDKYVKKFAIDTYDDLLITKIATFSFTIPEDNYTCS